MLVAGEPMLSSLVEVGGVGGKTALLALGGIERGALGQAARRLAVGLDARVPSWVSRVGTATVVRAFSRYSPGDGEAILLDADCLGSDAHTVAVFVDARYGRFAKQIRLIRAIDPLVPHASADDLQLEPCDRDAACERVLQAIARSDSTPGCRLDESVGANRALAIARLTARST
jgi:hypothetical protein